MDNFLSLSEIKTSNNFQKKGYVIGDLDNKKLIFELDKIIYSIIKKFFKKKRNYKIENLLNNIHNEININEINSIRLKIINKINKSSEIRRLFYLSAKKYLDCLIGNELVMQNRINLSIQLPNDDSSLLDLHSDVWSGDSPFEIVVWLPLVNCFKTKSMFLLKPRFYSAFHKDFKNIAKKDPNKIFKHINKKIEWMKINRGKILLFDQTLPHGNRINLEKETRWSLNCRFKSIFSPYGDKKIGEFFSPITLRKISEIGMNYNLPKLKK